MRTRMRFLVAAICAVSFALSGNVANADLIIDTGEAGTIGAGWTLNPDHDLAGEIMLGQNYTITGIEGWMWQVTSGELTVAIYDDGGNVPGPTELFSTSFAADIPDLDPLLFEYGWVGTHGLTWNLGPGTYWVAFEVRSGDAFFAMPWLAPAPLDHYAGRAAGDWSDVFPEFPNDMGFRVFAVVPEPASLGLLGLGLVGFAARAYRTRKC